LLSKIIIPHALSTLISENLVDIGL